MPDWMDIDDLPDYVDEEYPGPPEASLEDAPALVWNGENDEGLWVPVRWDHDEILQEFGLSDEKYSLVLEAFPNLNESVNTTLDAEAETAWLLYLGDQFANMAEVLRKQQVLGRIRKAVPRIVIIDIHEHARPFDDEIVDASPDAALDACIRPLLLHPLVRRGPGKSLHIWDPSLTIGLWWRLTDYRGNLNVSTADVFLFPDEKDKWRVWLMKHGKGDDWLTKTQEEQIMLERAHAAQVAAEEQAGKDARRPRNLNPAQVTTLTRCLLTNIYGECDPLAHENYQDRQHSACPEGCDCFDIFANMDDPYCENISTAIYRRVWGALEQIRSVSTSTMLSQIGMGRDEGAALPDAWLAADYRSDDDIIRSLRRSERSLLMNIHLRFKEFSQARTKYLETEAYKLRYATIEMMDEQMFYGDNIFVSVLKREIHLEMTTHNLTWGQIVKLLQGEPYDHDFRAHGCHVARWEGSAVDAAVTSVDTVPVPVNFESSAHANRAASEVNAAISLLLLNPDGAGDDRSSDDQLPDASDESANGDGKHKRESSEDGDDGEQGESKRSRTE